MVRQPVAKHSKSETQTTKVVAIERYRDELQFYVYMKNTFSKKHGKRRWYLFVCEKRKKDEPAGIGSVFVAMLNSDILRGLADTS